MSADTITCTVGHQQAGKARTCGLHQRFPGQQTVPIGFGDVHKTSMCSSKYLPLDSLLYQDWSCTEQGWLMKTWWEWPSVGNLFRGHAYSGDNQFVHAQNFWDEFSCKYAWRISWCVFVIQRTDSCGCVWNVSKVLPGPVQAGSRPFLYLQSAKLRRAAQGDGHQTGIVVRHRYV